jgi:ribosomal protein S18 acetylase RimI-like enzyme
MANNNPLVLRPTKMHEDVYLKKWLKEPGVLRWFPMADEREIDDAVRLWIAYSQIGSCITAEFKGIPCGMATLYIQGNKKLAHQCLFSIIVSEFYRGKGVGKALLQELQALGKKKFSIELLHLEVYDGNPAIHLYQREGFVEYGRHKHFIKDNGEYLAKILMQKTLKAES